MRISLGSHSQEHVGKLVAALAIVVMLFCFCLTGCGGGGTTSAPAPTPTPVPGPQITSINPSTVGGGFIPFTLTVNGSLFQNNSVVQWNGSPRTTMFVSSTQLTAAITAADVATPGNVTVTVATPGFPSSPAASTTFVVAPFPPPFPPTFLPMNAFVNGPAFTLDVLGGNITTASTVLWNGSPRPTTFISITELHAAISSADLANVGAVSVAVMNPAPGGGAATSANSFFIFSNPAPQLFAVSPNQALRGDPNLTLTVTGSNFVPSSTVFWDGLPRKTTFVNSGTLQADLVSADFITTGFNQVTVSNPAPGGGTSTAVQFTVALPITAVSQTANDMVYDPVQKVIYLSVPGTAATNPNTIAVMDPVSATISSTVAAGLNPNVLAISGDSTLLYASLDGTVNTPSVTPAVRGSVQQFALPALTAGINYQLADDSFGPPTVLDMQVAPGAPHTTAVVLGNRQIHPPSQGGIMIFDDATPRTNSLPSGGANVFDVLQWGADPTALFAGNTDNSNSDFYTLVVDANGVTLGQDFLHFYPFGGGRFSFDPVTQLVYLGDGRVIVPPTGVETTDFTPGDSTGLVAVDSVNNSVYFLVEQFPGSTNFNVFKFHQITHQLLSTMPLASSINGFPLRFIRWGTSGLGFVTSTGNVYLLTQ